MPPTVLFALRLPCLMFVASRNQWVELKICHLLRRLRAQERSLAVVPAEPDKDHPVVTLDHERLSALRGPRTRLAARAPREPPHNSVTGQKTTHYTNRTSSPPRLPQLTHGVPREGQHNPYGPFLHRTLGHHHLQAERRATLPELTTSSSAALRTCYTAGTYPWPPRGICAFLLLRSHQCFDASTQGNTLLGQTVCPPRIHLHFFSSVFPSTKDAFSTGFALVGGGGGSIYVCSSDLSQVLDCT